MEKAEIKRINAFLNDWPELLSGCLGQFGNFTGRMGADAAQVLISTNSVSAGLTLRFGFAQPIRKTLAVPGSVFLIDPQINLGTHSIEIASA